MIHTSVVCLKMKIEFLTAPVDGRNRISGRRWKEHFFGGPCDPQNQREFEQGECVEFREWQEEEHA